MILVWRLCVAWTALDARKAGFEAYVIEDACRGIDTQGSLAKAWADMAKAGVKRIQSSDIAVYFRSGGFILRDAADTPLFRMRS